MPETKMRNLSMKRKLESGEALSVREEGALLETCPPKSPCHYELRRFVTGKDYCDPVTETWIWSIGREHGTGVIIASTSPDMYQNPDYECLFLR